MASKDLPLLVLLPGLDGSGRFFKRLQAALGAHIDSVVISYPSEGPQSYDALASAAIEHLPLDRDYVLVAESFGGPVAILAAARAKPPPLGIILAATFARSPFPLAGSLLRFVLPALIKQAAAPALMQHLLLRPGDDALAFDLAATIAAMYPRLIEARCCSALTCNVQRELNAINAPALYLQGRNDKLISAACGLLMKATSQRVRLIPCDAPHFVLQYDRDALVNDHILPFLHEVR